MPATVARAVWVGEFIALRCRRCRRPGRSVERLGQAEVEHLDRSVVPDLDVRGLEVAMDDALFVRRFERVRNLAGDGNGLVDRDSGRLGKALGKRRPVHELHDERACAARPVARLLRSRKSARCADD